MKSLFLLSIIFMGVTVTSQNSPNPAEDIFELIEKVPVYPGCESLSNNEELKRCMFKNISEFIGEKFNLDIAKNLNLKGRQRIEVSFNINKNGWISEIKPRGPHPLLEEEALKILMSLPQMVPGEQKGKPVTIAYLLPIVFVIEE